MVSYRSGQGGTLALTAACAIVITILGLIFVFLSGLLGGSRELENATDAGALNLAKQAAISPAIQLNSGIEQNNFAGLAGPNGAINLLNFNRLVGQTLIVAANAQAENTTLAHQNTQQLVAALQAPTSSIAQRLLSAFNNGPAPSEVGAFNGVAFANSLRMLNGSQFKQDPVHPFHDQYMVSYMDAGQASNVFLDPTILPVPANLPANALSSIKSPSGQCYISGYTDITFAGMPAIAGATMHPQQQPYLVRQSDFATSAVSNVSAGAVPPNAFMTAAQASAGGGNGLENLSSSTVGALNSIYPACIPNGYIVVSNPAGDQMPSNMPLPSNESIFNNQLFTGIFVSNTGCFSTDESQIQAWADYNNGGRTGQAPATDGLFNVLGLPVSGEQYGITALGGNGYPVMADYTNVQGPNQNQAAANMLPSFEKAYPADMSSGNADGTLTAVEDLNAEVMQLYTNNTGGAPATVAATGLRVFNHNQAYVIGAGQTPVFTTAGNIAQLCAQSDPNGDPTVICKMIEQRMREINPSATNAEMYQVLGLDSTGATAVANSAQTIDLGQTFYIWYDGKTFQMTQTLPPWITTVSSPDGNAQSDATNYPTIGLSVDPVGECGFNQTLFADQPNPQTDYLGVDTTTWTPSSGFNNLLGSLSFGESISGSAVVLGPTTQVTCSSNPQVAAVESYLQSAGATQTLNLVNGAVSGQPLTQVVATLQGMPGVSSVYASGAGYDENGHMVENVTVTFTNSSNCSPSYFMTLN